jgi:hypothetical protein
MYAYLGHVEVVEAHGEEHALRELLLALALCRVGTWRGVVCFVLVYINI